MYTLTIQTENGLVDETFDIPEAAGNRVLEVGKENIVGYSNNCEGWIALMLQPAEIKIDGIAYHVIKHESTEEIGKRYPNTAKQMTEANITGRVILQKPKGKVLFESVIKNGRFTKPLRAA